MDYNYKYIVNDKEVIALSTFAGKTVRGVAKCSPEDTFDVEYGKRLAAARCNLKIAKKKIVRGEARMDRVNKFLAIANAEKKSAQVYIADAVEKHVDALNLLDKILSEKDI